MTEVELVLAVQRLAIYGTILAAFVGGAVGFLGHLASTFLTRRAERRRQLVQLVELGMKQFITTSGGDAASFLPQLYVHLNVRFLELLEAGKLTTETYKKLATERDKLRAIVE
ncbi:MAG: hypothetical protein WB384_27480 [Candidatus Sulfotelmatobacter sp.]